MPGFHWLPDPVQERLLARQGRRDARRLRRRVPGLAAAADGAGPGGGPAEIGRAHALYLERTGTDRIMAASVPFARFLWAWCEAREPSRIADLGSGFTSWVLRRWARDRGVERLVSVDDRAGWLDASRDFVRERGLEDSGFLRWEDFRDTRGRFDLVVWDFADIRTRAAETRRAAGRVASGGALLVDDVHKARIWRRVRWLDWWGGADGYSLRAMTRDDTGRYAWLGLF